MNERIKELAQKAGTTLVSNGCYEPTEIFNKEKFAELIIKECVGACEKNSWMGLNAFQRAGQIKNHFGVK